MLSQNIKKLRRDKGLTQGELGEKIGLKHNTIAGYESGRTIPTADVLKSIADVLDVSVDALMILETPTGTADVRTITERDRDTALSIIEKQQDMLTEQGKTIAKLVDILGGK